MPRTSRIVQTIAMASSVPKWEELATSLRVVAPPDEKSMREQWDAGYGPPNYKSKLRLFDLPPGTVPRIKFWHDHNVWCPFCATMWFYLEEKRIPYESVTVNKEGYTLEGGESNEANQMSQHYFGRLGAGGVPGVQIDGGRLISGANFLAIEQHFPDNPLIPDEDDPAADRWGLMQLAKRSFEASFWNLNKADVKGPVVESREYAQFVEQADRLNELLGEAGPYLCGEKMTVLDIQFVVDAEQVAAFLPYFKGVQVRRNPRWPNIERWFVAMESRPTYSRMATDYYSKVSATPLQRGPPMGPKHPDAAAFAAQIDGTEGSWSLPLPEDDGSLIEPISTFGRTDMDVRCEAAERILHNHRAVVGFAARGEKKPSTQKFGARNPAYAKKYGTGIPDAQSGADIGITNLGRHYGGPDELEANREIEADVALRCTVNALLKGPSDDIKAALAEAKLSPEGTRASLGYLRDRISVPRDMSRPAARQLRAHLNWVISTVDDASKATSVTPKQVDVM